MKVKVLATLIATLTLPLAALAANDALKKMEGSDTSKNLKAQALAKVGADVTPSPAGARTYFIEPKNGATVASPVHVVFGLAGMGVAPAGTQVANTGHFHLIVDDPRVDMNAPLPKSDQVIHYGAGQTEAMVPLKAGKHTLQIVLGDWKHQPHSPAVVSDKITITVK